MAERAISERSPRGSVRVPLDLTEGEALALAQMAKRLCHEDIARLSSRFDRYPCGRMEVDVMLSAVLQLQRALAEAGFAPR